jgi:hypothetical protein
MRPIAVEPPAEVNLVALLACDPRRTSQISFGQRLASSTGGRYWAIVDSEYNEARLSGFSSGFAGWWPMQDPELIE